LLLGAKQPRRVGVQSPPSVLDATQLQQPGVVKDRSLLRRSTRSSTQLRLEQSSNQYPGVECRSPHAHLNSLLDSHLERHQGSYLRLLQPVEPILY